MIPEILSLILLGLALEYTLWRYNRLSKKYSKVLSEKEEIDKKYVRVTKLLETQIAQNKKKMITLSYESFLERVEYGIVIDSSTPKRAHYLSKIHNQNRTYFEGKIGECQNTIKTLTLLQEKLDN